MTEEKTYLLKMLAETWSKYPHLRLGQLLVNVVGVAKPCPEIFYIEDRKLAKELMKWMPEN